MEIDGIPDIETNDQHSNDNNNIDVLQSEINNTTNGQTLREVIVHRTTIPEQTQKKESDSDDDFFRSEH